MKFEKIIVVYLICGLLITISSIPALSTTHKDGFSLFKKACQLYKSSNSDDSCPDCLVTDFLETGRNKKQVMEIIKRNEAAIALLKKAAQNDTWNRPSPDPDMACGPAPIPVSIINLRKVVAAKVVVEFYDGKPVEALNLLKILNNIGLKLINNGEYIDFAAHHVNRNLEYPVLITVMTELPKSMQKRAFKSFYEQYKNFPSVITVYQPEINKQLCYIDKMFKDVEMVKAFTEARETLFAELKKLDTEPDVITNLFNSQLLTLEGLHKEVKQQVVELENYRLQQLENATLNELKTLDNRLKKRVDDLGSGIPFKILTSAAKLQFQWMLNQRFSVRSAEDYHKQISRAIAYQFIKSTWITSGKIGISYRAFVAKERLALINMAISLYPDDISHTGKTLHQLCEAGLLVYEDIIDPMSNKLFRTKIDKSGRFIVYSVGEDLDDDGGIDGDNTENNGDIIIKLIP